MTPKIKLRIPLNDFVFEVRRLALYVSRHVDCMSKATGGKISARTAVRMTELVDRLVEIDIARVRMTGGSVRDVVRDAEKLITAIATAARYAGKTEPTILERLNRVRSGKMRRSAAAVKFALEMHLGLAREEPSAIGALLPATVEAEAAQLVERLNAHDAAVKNATEHREKVAEERYQIVGELKQLTSDVRALATVLGRVAPELACEFARAADAPSRHRRGRSAVNNDRDATGQR